MALISVYDEAGNVIETHEHKAISKNQNRPRIVFDCRMVDDPAMMSSTIPQQNLTQIVTPMPAALTILGRPIRADLKLNELPRVLAQETPNLVVFEWQPIPGRIAGAAFDWVAVLDITADLVAIASGLWTVYEKLIKKRKEPGAAQPPAFDIRVENERQTFVHLTIEEGTTKEAFTEEFTRTVSALRASETGQSAEAIIEVYERSESHRRVSRVHKDVQPHQDE